MNSLNRVEIIGNLTREPELKTTRTGQSVTTIGVATNRKWKDTNGEMKEEAEYHNVVCWGKLAEISCQYLTKGSKAFFSGRLQTRNWEDDGGIKHYRTEIVAQDMIILSSNKGGGGSANYSQNSAPVPQDNAAYSDSGELTPDDLPF